MPKGRWTRWLPDTLAWWMFTVLVGVVILMSATTLAFLFINRNETSIIAAAGQAADQVIIVKRTIERDKPEDRAQLIRRLNSAAMRMVITRNPIVEDSDDGPVTRVVLRKLRREFPAGTDIRVDSLIAKPKQSDVGQAADENNNRAPEVIEIPEPPPPTAEMRQNVERFNAITPEEREARLIRQMRLGGPAPLDSQGMFRVSVKFAENTWFNVRVLLTVGEDAQVRSRPFIVQTTISLLIALAALWGVSRAFRPLALFASAAERLGVDFNAEQLPETGPGEVRRAARAFNTMQTRLKRFIEDRTQMLAAISHDLRTPITRLRLRAEFVEDDDQRAKMMRDLEEMEAMIAATLAFSRDDAAREPAIELDVAGLLQAVAADARAAGQDVTYSGPERRDVVARPLALKRALTNLVDNACKYGSRARLTLEPHAETVDVLVDDDGPGIADVDRERVFAPFVRLEASRSRETGGVGLGLTIARNTIRGMGGDVDLRSRVGGGLRVRVILPAAILEQPIAAE